MNLKRKYIHILIQYGQLYVYADDSKHGQKISLDEIDNECLIGEIEHRKDKKKVFDICLNLKDFIEK